MKLNQDVLSDNIFDAHNSIPNPFGFLTVSNACQDAGLGKQAYLFSFSCSFPFPFAVLHSMRARLSFFIDIKEYTCSIPPILKIVFVKNVATFQWVLSFSTYNTISIAALFTPICFKNPDQKIPGRNLVIAIMSLYL